MDTIVVVKETADSGSPQGRLIGATLAMIVAIVAVELLPFSEPFEAALISAFAVTVAWGGLKSFYKARQSQRAADIMNQSDYRKVKIFGKKFVASTKDGGYVEGHIVTGGGEIVVIRHE